jgi:hypothetical protein
VDERAMSWAQEAEQFAKHQDFIERYLLSDAQRIVTLKVLSKAALRKPKNDRDRWELERIEEAISKIEAMPFNE